MTNVSASSVAASAGIITLTSVIVSFWKIPEVQSAISGVTRDPEVRAAAAAAASDVGRALAKSWRTNSVGVGPAVINWMRFGQTNV